MIRQCPASQPGPRSRLHRCHHQLVAWEHPPSSAILKALPEFRPAGRTGLTALTTAVCFVSRPVLTPVILMIPGAAVAPALVVVGLVMFQDVTELDLRDFEMAAPAILTILMMPLSFSISTGIGLGLIMLSVLSIGAGREDHRGYPCSCRDLFVAFFRAR